MGLDAVALHLSELARAGYAEAKRGGWARTDAGVRYIFCYRASREPQRKHADLPGLETAILRCLLEHAKDIDGWAPSENFVSDFCGSSSVGEGRVWSAIEYLEERGLILIRRYDSFDTRYGITHAGREYLSERGLGPL